MMAFPQLFGAIRLFAADDGEQLILRFLFWNIRSQPLQRLIAACAAEQRADVVMMTECGIIADDLEREFGLAGSPGLISDGTSSASNIRVFSRFPLHSVYDDANNHVAIRRLIVRRRHQVLLVIVHLQSKRNWRDNDQLQGASRLARSIHEWEQKFARAPVLVVGDLNMNPFEPGIVGSEGLHAVMTRDIAKRGGRIVDGEHRSFLYNPMWRFFGERSDGPPGTYYYEASGIPTSYYWNIFDQVLVRPALVNKLKDVRIIDKIGAIPLLDDRGVPDATAGSDHLPLVFTLDFSEV